MPTFDNYTRNITTFEQYATKYWAEHSRYNERAEISCEHTMKLTETFLKNSSFLNWKRNYTKNFNREYNHYNILDIIAVLGLHKSARRLVNRDSSDCAKFHNDVKFKLKAILNSAGGVTCDRPAKGLFSAGLLFICHDLMEKFWQVKAIFGLWATFLSSMGILFWQEL
ncbi:hypothetical protein FB446DRAFT_757770 [Lentinula raphanica]|nr:hypothetical protein FB446DRAFT_757770 [Lentinula raphanica]